ncbi:hypothetical protein I215_05487 [Galbibacter marinus]|uniref:UPF0246 protein I215_05487 n=1 Tax=Galbibacter marinus TaxID=555500 RepID=K2Q4A0_9FLAO|nr:peroxide stress protein YaaA [Galbibacter marinus]EKF55661.1 hypothetical protein I215_05487 [Galbibacter marinus]
MKIVISPAKSLDFESPLPVKDYTQPEFLEQSQKLNEVLQKKTPKKLSDLMGISANLAELNWKRNQDFEIPFTSQNARPAVFAFNGDVYTGLDAYSLDKDKFAILQQQLRILSGLYGVLKPLDLIQPYRLEMGTKLHVGSHKDLYGFWKKKITAKLNDELEADELFINLASNEYFGAIDEKSLKVPVITPIFKDWKNDKLKIISFFAKKARGAMVRYIVDTNAQTLEDIKGFNTDGYQYSEQYTQREDQPVFVR